MFRHCKDIERPLASTDPIYMKRIYKCDVCTDSEGWDSETEVFIHRTVSHQEALSETVKKADTEPVCLICIRKFNSPSSLQKHINREHLLSSEDARRVEREMFVCDICSQVFFNKDMLVVHLAQNHKFKDKTERMDCPKCKKSFQVNGLWSHFQFHQMLSVSSCPICLDKCQDREALQEHLKTHPKYYYCESCSYQTNKRDCFYDHVARHENLTTRRKKLSENILKKYFVGSKCDHLWRERQKLNVFRGLILSKQVQICIICREICKDKNKMKQHILKHMITLERDANKNIHVCVCGEQFFSKILLKHHELKAEGKHRPMDINVIRQKQALGTWAPTSQEQNKGSGTEVLKFTDINYKMYHIDVQSETKEGDVSIMEVTEPSNEVIVLDIDKNSSDNSDEEPMSQECYCQAETVLPVMNEQKTTNNIQVIDPGESMDNDLPSETILPDINPAVAESTGKELPDGEVNLITKEVVLPVMEEHSTVTKKDSTQKGNSLPVIDVE